MRIALVSPASSYASYGVPGETIDPPMGLLSIATILSDKHEVKIFDGQLYRCRPSRLATHILDWQPEMIGLSVNFSTVVSNAKVIAKEIRHFEPEIPLIFGGNFVTFNWKELVQQKFVDAIVLNEAEQVVTQLVDWLNGQADLPDSCIDCRSTNFVKAKKSQYLQNLDALPFCNFDLLEYPERYVKTIVSSRGCPFSCIYCSTSMMWRSWRCRSANSVVAEMLMLYDRYNSEQILFADDTFLVNQQRGVDIAMKLKTKGCPVKWGFSTRLETLNEKIIPILAEGGVNAIFLGIESGSDQVLSQMNRNYSYEDVVRKVELCRDVGIVCTTSFIIGLPWENEDDIDKTFDLMRRVDTPRVLLNIFTPLPGTPVFNNPDEFGIHFIEKIDPEKLVVGHGYVNYNTRYLSTDLIKQRWMEGQGIVMQKARDLGIQENNHMSFGVMHEPKSEIV